MYSSLSKVSGNNTSFYVRHYIFNFYLDKSRCYPSYHVARLLDVLPLVESSTTLKGRKILSLFIPNPKWRAALGWVPSFVPTNLEILERLEFLKLS
jgi:hypothetical protein